MLLHARGVDLSNKEPGLIEGFFLCLRDSRSVRVQTSRWKRSLLVFSSGICLEIGAVPVIAALISYELTWQVWLLSSVFLTFGILGLFVSKYGDDRFVEKLLVIPKLDLKI